jgi:hypothetical protein
MSNPENTQTEVLPPDEAAMRNMKPAEGAFQTPDQFAHAQRIGKMLVKSPMVPEHFRGDANLANAVIALDMAFRMKVNPLLLMSQLYMVHGKPGLSAQLVIAVINCSGKFSRLRFKVTGEGDDMGCFASAREVDGGEELVGTRVTIGLAKKEGWFQKNGSKWQTMPEQMLVYRSASFWGRMYAPEMLMGLQTIEELEDTGPAVVTTRPIFKEPAKIEAAVKATTDAIMSEITPAINPEPKEERDPNPKPTGRKYDSVEEMMKGEGIPPQVQEIVQPKIQEPAPSQELLQKARESYDPTAKLRAMLREKQIEEKRWLTFLCDIGVTDEEYPSLNTLAVAEPFALTTSEMKFSKLHAAFVAQGA